MKTSTSNTMTIFMDLNGRIIFIPLAQDETNSRLQSRKVNAIIREKTRRNGVSL